MDSSYLIPSKFKSFGVVVNNKYMISYPKLVSKCLLFPMSFLSWGKSKFLPHIEWLPIVKFVFRYILDARCQVSGVTCQVSGVRCQVSHVRCHMSHVTCQVLHVFFSSSFWGQSGRVSLWRVCYQRGLPRLVSSVGAPLLSDCLRCPSNFNMKMFGL